MQKSDLAGFHQAQYDALYFGTLIQRSTASRKALHTIVGHGSFPTVICDVNLRPNCYDEDSIAFCLSHATILKVSMEEEPILRTFGGYLPTNESPEAIAKAICQQYPQMEMVIVTSGKDGLYAYLAKDGKGYHQAAMGDTVVSTVGAGDSFTAAWLVSYLYKKPIEVCMKRASAMSGFVVSQTEAVPIYDITDFDG